MSDLIDLCDSSDDEDFGSDQDQQAAVNSSDGPAKVKVEATASPAPIKPDAAPSASQAEDKHDLSPTTLAATAAATIASDEAANSEPSPVIQAAALKAADTLLEEIPASTNSTDVSARNTDEARSLQEDVDAERNNDDTSIAAKEVRTSHVSDDCKATSQKEATAPPEAPRPSAVAAQPPQQQQPPPAAAPSDGSSSDETPNIQDEPSTATIQQLRDQFDALPEHIRSRYCYGLSTTGLILMGEAIAREVMELALNDDEAIAFASSSTTAAAPASSTNAIGNVSDDGGIDGSPMPRPVEEGSNHVDNADDLDDDIREALELSKKTAKEEEEQRARYRQALASMTPTDKKRSNCQNGGDDDNEVIDMTPLQIRTRLPRREFDTAIESVIQQMGGWDKIDNGGLVKAGNMQIKKADMAAGGGMAQTRAQYGRYTCEGFWRLIDVLEGREEADLKGDEDNEKAKADSVGDDEKDENNAEKKRCEGVVCDVEDDRKPSAVSESNDDAKSSPRSLRKRKRRNFLPDTRPIRAHVDIGHGIGIQVLQAGLGLGIVSRGVEIMKGRQAVAESIREDLLTCLRRDPPDMSRIEMHHKDFSRACLPDDETGKCDEWLRTHLLCRDLSEEEQKGLVIFVNNAREIFAARSCNTRGISAPLDAHLAELFGNMKVGGRMVTLEDISSHLHQNANWYRKDVFQSGSEAVTWGGKSIEIFVFTKLRDDWTCQVRFRFARAHVLFIYCFEFWIRSYQFFLILYLMRTIHLFILRCRRTRNVRLQQSLAELP